MTGKMDRILFRLFAFVVVLGCARAVRTTVTNEDIRDAILQVVNVVRTTEDKLERHEYRERVLGENLKKGMISIDKRIKQLEPFKGTINRLDERLAAVETILMQKDERERIQLQKTFDTVEDIQKNLPVIVDKLKTDIINKLSELKASSAGNKPETGTIAKEELEKLEKSLTKEVDKIAINIADMRKDLDKIKEDSKSIREISNKSSENLDKVKRQLSTSEQLLSKYESKLAEYNNRIPEVPANYKDQNDWHSSFLQALEAQKANVEQIFNNIEKVSTKINQLPNQTQSDLHHNTTQEHLERIRDDIGQLPTKTSQLFDSKTNEIKDSVLENMKNSSDNISQNLTNLDEKFSKHLDKLQTEIESLSKVEQVMMQTADAVLDTKRRVEYGVHQIIAEMQKVIKESSKDVDAAISERFDTFEMSILDENNGALANLTAKIGKDIDQVWRQIGIMHSQMSASTDTLNKLQNQTDSYVNGSLSVMDNMKGKVGTITSRIKEVDENLNFLLGRLSLVTQEFNQVKHGLGKALEEMRDTYKSVKNKVPEGPGPHKIDSSESPTK